MSRPDNDENPHRLSPRHPPRLQHSPSLPNISNSWAEPYNNTTLQATGSKHHSRNSTPAARVSLDLVASESADSTSPSTPTQQNHPLSSYKSKLKSKNHPPLLTPPLTPSSSLTSEGSNGTENSLSANDEPSGEVPGREPVPPSRFLLIGNTPRHVSTDELKEFFFRSPSDSTRNERRNGSPLKGIYARLHDTDGIIILAFHDLRDADRVKTSIETIGVARTTIDGSVRQDGILDDRDADVGQPWERGLTCRFITPRDLRKRIGDSKFLSKIDGGFFVYASGRSLDRAGVNQRRVVAPESLKHFLGSFGNLCQFQAVRPEVEESTDDDTQIFWVEYYDVRDATNAKDALNGRTIFGVRLTLSSRDSSNEDSESEGDAYDDNNQQETQIQIVDSPPSLYSSITPTATNCVPFPSSLPQVEDQGNGNASKHGIFYTSSQARPRSISADNDGPSGADSSSGIASGASYPTSFSSTHSRSPLVSPSVCDIYPQVDPHGRRSSNYHLFDAVSKQTQEHQERPRYLNADIPADFRPVVDEQDTPTVSPTTAYLQQHQQHTPYLYSTPHDTTYFSYYNPSSQASSHPPPSAAMHFPLPPVYHPEHANLHNWTWTPAAPAGPIGMAANSGPAVHGFYIPSGPSPVPASHVGGMYYPQHVPVALGGDLHPQVNLPEGVEYSSTYHLHPQYPDFFPPSPNDRIPLRLSDSPKVAPSRLHPTNTNKEGTSGQSNERNQLNLARIEDGQDTRTTVMVKNIPNKMSDKDLIAYIGNVCPKRIDFLYLRMDFQNECNVGYAFVNFITVGDLLNFAKAKLGIKWNMFSSEKVLQMSYANYQGKEALVEKFKNSCIMDEREAWRPKIFYSEPGTQQGMPEPFPAPTHIRRKERSSLNRGALFIPSASGSHHLHNVANREQRAHASDEQPNPLEPEETDSPVEGHRNTHLSAPTPLTSSRLKKANQHQASRATR